MYIKDYSYAQIWQNVDISMNWVELQSNQAPVVQTMDSAIHRINHYPADKHKQNQLSYPKNSDLSSG